MALTLDQLKRLADQENFRYFVDPAKPVLLAGVQGLAGKYQFVMILELNGQFLQFRSIGYLHCAPDHRHLSAVLRLIAELNYQFRFVKFSWDARDGEVVVYGDTWIMDGTLTQQQFSRLLGNYLPSLDQQYLRISQTIETGKDPGPVSPEDLLERLPGGPSLAQRLRELLGLTPKPEPDVDSI